MNLITDADALRPFAGCVFVPTMGALHEGHASLIRHAAALRNALHGASKGPPVVVSIFVNPTQFDDPADLARYPRTLDADLALCRAGGADYAFVPSVETVYPPGVTIPTPPLPAAATEPRLEDALRPGHFAGVCQVVARLFAIVHPRTAVFGEKDFQQLAVIRGMVAASSRRPAIIPAPTVRERDGLAMSSRNRFIPPQKRAQAAAISRALCEASAPAHHTPQRAEAAMRRVLLEAGFAARDIQYAVVRDAATLTAPRPGMPARALIAVNLPPVRLIDNAPWGDKQPQVNADRRR
ncbi:MAG: pantoate--beta-alanine ligase [Phycisphaerales bacterium]|nr:pantoate--beta-alanine ligase [Phycisphaerales bacterium]